VLIDRASVGVVCAPEACRQTARLVAFAATE
jgi:hypothetical protein